MEYREITPQQQVANRFRRNVRGFLSGGLLRRPDVLRRLPYVFITLLLMLFLIASGYRTQRINRRYIQLSNEVKELRTKSLSINEMRMTATRQSEIIKRLQEAGIELQESVVPPQVVE
jgi:hypothetical protein